MNAPSRLPKATPKRWTGDKIAEWGLGRGQLRPWPDHVEDAESFDLGRDSRFPCGWWILPGALIAMAFWVAVAVAIVTVWRLP